MVWKVFDTMPSIGIVGRLPVNLYHHTNAFYNTSLRLTAKIAYPFVEYLAQSFIYLVVVHVDRLKKPLRGKRLVVRVD